MRFKPVGMIACAGFVCAAALADENPGPQPAAAPPAALETVVVTGSRIPKLALDVGPSPVTTITAQDIQNYGFTDMADVMRSVTQNLGEVDNNQQTDGFSPGAQAVDLRGMGPNHTLVLVNSRRIADYPQAYQGNSNFTNIGNIPVTMIDRVEILSGSDSAIYGSDAIAGVINFKLKKSMEGTTIDFRDGETQHKGGSSQRLALTSGFSDDNLEGIFAVQLTNQQPLWAFQRSFTTSRLNSPADPSDIHASPVFMRQDVDGDYLAPPPGACNSLAHLDNGTVFQAERDGYGPDSGPGYWCGSNYDVGYGTLENGNREADLYSSLTYHLNSATSLFLDTQYGYSRQMSYDTPLQWQNSYPLNGDSTPVPFFNQATGMIEQWQRKYFTLEENGGLSRGQIYNYNHTLALNVGVDGSFGPHWNYEGYYSHSQDTLESKIPALVAAEAQALYLGPSLGIDPDSGFNIYNAPLSRLYTPLTPAQFRSITNISVDNDKTHTDSLNFNVNTGSLMQLPAGPLGFAGVLEYGHDYANQDVDPMSLDGSYYGLHNTSATGSRDRYGAGVEFNVPILSSLTATAATRLDEYSYSGTNAGKVTYNAGLEYRPVPTLLLRGTYGTGFRAPDLAYLYAGPSGSSSDGTDYYLCRTLEPESGPDYFDNCTYGDVDYNGRSHGSTTLKDETSTSFTYGFVFTPWRTLQLSADYYQITLKNEVQYQTSDQILRAEANCRIGQTPDGAPVNGSSPGCAQVESQVVRNPATDLSNPQGVTSVLVLPINAAEDHTSGMDIKLRYQQPTERAGTFDFEAGFTDVFTHTIQYYKGGPIDNELTDYYYWVIPRWKGMAGIGWSYGKVSTSVFGSALGGLPNYDGTERLSPTYLMNATFAYHILPEAVLTLSCNNVFDQHPQRDPTWTDYPYYASRWFNPVGREFFAEFSYHFDWPKH